MPDVHRDDALPRGDGPPQATHSRDEPDIPALRSPTPNSSGTPVKTMMELLPLAVGVAVVGAVTWFLLDRDWAFGPWLLAGLLFAHGWVHVMFVVPTPPPSAGGPAWPFDMSRSWLVTGAGLDVGLVRAVGIVLMIVVCAGFLLAALSTVQVIVPAAWWSVLVGGAAAASLLLLALFFSPMLTLGVGIDVILLWFVIAAIWSPAATAVPGGAA